MAFIRRLQFILQLLLIEKFQQISKVEFFRICSKGSHLRHKNTILILRVSSTINQLIITSAFSLTYVESTPSRVCLASG